MVTITLQNTTPHHILNQKPQWANTTSQVCGHCPGQHEAILAAGGHQEHPNAATQNLVLSCFYRHSEPQGWLWVFTSFSQFYHSHFPSSALLGSLRGWQGRLEPELGRTEPQPRQTWCSDWWLPGPLWLRDHWEGQCHHHSGAAWRMLSSPGNRTSITKSPSIAQHPKGCFCVTGAVHCTQTAGTNWALGVFW